MLAKKAQHGMHVTVEPFSTSGPPAQVLRLAQFARVLWRYAWLILLCGITGAALTFFYVRTLPKVYTASTAITVEGAGFVIPELQGATGRNATMDPMPAVRTETQAIASHSLLQAVIHQQNLASYPEFNPSLRQPTLLSELQAQIRDLLPASAETAHSGDNQGIDEAVLDNVKKQLSIFQDNRSLVIALGFTARDPVVASNFVNELVSAYIRSRAKSRMTVNEQANDILVERTTAAKAALDAIEQQMRALRDRSEMVQLRAGSVGQQQLEDLATAAARASLERSQLEANWSRAVALSKQGVSDALQNVLNSPTIGNLRQQESAAASRLADLSARFGSNYPGVSSAAANLQSVHGALSREVQRIVGSMDAQLRVARDQEAQVKQQLDDARRRGVVTENERAQLEELQQEEKSRRALYQTLLERSQQTVAQPAGTETPDVRVLSAAVPPESPSGPDTKLSGGFGALAGLLFGCMLALTRIRSVDGSADPGVLERMTGLPVLTTVRRNLLKPGRNGWDVRVAAAPHGEAANIARAVRKQISFSGRTRVPKSVMFTTIINRACTPVAALAIARVAAADGENVLFMEMDAAEAGLGSMLPPNSVGLGEVLARDVEWREALMQDPSRSGKGAGRLEFLLSRSLPIGAGAALDDVAFQNLVVEVCEEYDLVVLSAPLAASAEASQIAQRVDATVVIIDNRKNPRTFHVVVARLGAASRNALQAVLVR